MEESAQIEESIRLELRNELAKNMFSESLDGRPTTIWHYTSSQGLLGILSSDSLWASATSMLNDARELDLGLEVLNTVWQERQGDILDSAAKFRSKWSVVKAGQRSASDKFTRPLAKEYLSTALSHLADTVTGMPAFVTCASFEKDSLSQWRYYAGQSGYAIELDMTQNLRVHHSRDLAEELTGNSFNMWRPVLYKESDQESAAAGALAASTMLVPPGEEAWDEVLPVTLMILLDFVVRVKHCGFQDEREARWVFSHQNFQAVADFHAGPRGITPHVSLVKSEHKNLSTRSNILTTSLKSKLPIKSIMVGPNPYSKAAVSGLQSALVAYGYNDVPIVESEVPYRF